MCPINVCREDRLQGQANENKFTAPGASVSSSAKRNAVGVVVETPGCGPSPRFAAGVCRLGGSHLRASPRSIRRGQLRPLDLRYCKNAMGWSPRVLAQCLAREGEFLALYIWGRKGRGGRDAGPRAICPGPAAVAAAVGTPSSQLAGMLTSAGPSGPAPGGRRALRSREWELCPTTPSRTGRWPLRSASSSTQSGAQEHRLPSFWGPSNLCPFLAAANDLSRVGHLSETVPHPPGQERCH